MIHSAHGHVTIPAFFLSVLLLRVFFHQHQKHKDVEWAETKKLTHRRFDLQKFQSNKHFFFLLISAYEGSDWHFPHCCWQNVLL